MARLSWRAEIINYAHTGGASNRFAKAVSHLVKNQKRSTWPWPLGRNSETLGCFGEAVDPDARDRTATLGSPR